MKASLIALLAASIVTTSAMTTAVEAQVADKRSFFHPFGFWSNDMYVKQRKIYEPIWKFGPVPVRYAYPGFMWDGAGGGVMHERNW